MTPEEFRALGHRMVDWVAAYWERVGELPVRSGARPGEVAGKLPGSAEELVRSLGGVRARSDVKEKTLTPTLSQGEREERQKSSAEWDRIFRDLDEIIVPGLTHWQSPNFFAYFPANASGPAVLGELLSAGLGVQGMLWQTSPACTELEIRVLDWLAELCGLPEAFLSTSPDGGGVIQGTASEAALVAMVAARARARSNSGSPERFTVYASTQAHSSIVRAAMIAGIARGPEDAEAVRLVGVDGAGAMKPDELAARVREDMDAGRTPMFVCATVGTTGTTAVDPVDRIAGALAGVNYRGWLHVDAAHAGSLALCPEFAWMFRGLDRADSYCFNPHKWMLTNFDCSCFWTRDRRAVLGALSITPEYLRNAATDAGQVTDFRDWQVPLGRRFRSLKLWFVLRHYGPDGLRAHLREHVRLAQVFEGLVRADARFEAPVPRTMNLVCFRLRGAGAENDARNRSLMDRLNASGALYLTHTVLPTSVRGEASGRVVLRMAIGAVRTGEEHVRAAWGRIRAEADELDRGAGPPAQVRIP